MKNFKLVDRLTIENPTMAMNKKALNCFLYQFKEGGFSVKQFTDWLDGKIMDIYEFTGRFGHSSRCPWCEYEGNLVQGHIRKHKKTEEDINTVKLSKQAYGLLLDYLRNGNYDALIMYVHRSCQYCINPITKGRKGMCAIPESARNKMRSVGDLRLRFNDFKTGNYGSCAVCIIYGRMPIRKEE
uniref:Uncharacterized protein n=1 Tax=viral metagenome TaxID=1070528 RepID=A0A6M3JSH8_9ZZZZ